ncbi:type II toxin-antitoxin system PemK/MazF family toxin [Actinoplanes sp. RD1]|uniref:type II toxin-antitoxin system PemK/MazF family toxin n=1 Tax=Actinoplanes sp. RD1 TaxID=3064538 RepID=UPI0027415846|nr:type II toxin-antitoxin system PemK/MazF family toxin [Actinoplanes sp. RD1]
MAQWLAAGLVVLVVAGAAVVWRRRRAAERPTRGDIWWADVPFARGRGAKLRPCLVLLNNRHGVVVLKITSQDKSHRRDHMRIPTRHWDRHAAHDSYLNLGEPILVRHTAFQRRAGTAAWTVRRQVRTRRDLAGSRLRELARRHHTRQNG